MATTDPRYMLAPSLEEYFIDKDTGLPLAGGLVTFYEDENRTIKKDIFMQSGSPPDYTYTALTNPVVLSSVGTFQDDNGNNILPYYFPYDSQGNIQLYYITVYSSVDNAGIVPAVLQFTRQGFPNSPSQSSGADDTLINYIPNGQFLAHNDIAATLTTAAGQITQAVTDIAQGGWSFNRPNTSAATDLVTFPRFGSAVTNPTGNPRYAIQIVNSVPSVGDAYKDLRIRFNNVNTFASTTDTFTFSFTAQSNTGSSIPVSIAVIKNFGTGGSAETRTPVGTTFNLTTSEQIYNIPIIFGTNGSSTIGALDDDYVQIAISFPTASAFSAAVTDAVLTPGDVVLSAFPAQTDADMLARGIAGWMPTPKADGSDLFLPLRLTHTGLEFDSSEVGYPIPSFQLTPNVGQLIANGNSYVNGGYSSDGIPYSRLFSKYFSGSNNCCLFGTGYQFVNTYVSTIANQKLRLVNNLFGSTTVAADGTAPTGFTFQTIITGLNTHAQGYIGANTPINNAIGIVNTVGSATASNAGTSGFSVSDSFDTTVSYHVFQCIPTAAAALANPSSAGKYWTFSTTAAFYMWFQITNETDPAPGGTGIKVNLQGTESGNEVAAIIKGALNGSQTTLITCLAASSVPASSFFTFNTGAQGYYVWYTVGGVGTDPAPATRIGIKVALTGSETNVQVATKTQIALNSYSVGTPDMRGLFIRGYDPTLNYDSDAIYRFSEIDPLIGNLPGTLELSQVINHTHAASSVASASNFSVSTFTNPAGSGFTGYTNNSGGSAGPFTQTVNAATVTTTIGATGGPETRASNMSVNWFIKY